jgi:hypothetical protein
MNDDLFALRKSASEMRSAGGRSFDGDFAAFNGETGEWKAGKAKTVINGRQAVADVYDLMLGWQKFKDKKFVYCGIGFVRNGHQPPARELLDERDEALWSSDKDPWQLCHYLAMFDPETREQFVFTTSSAGGKDALAELQDAFADHNEALAPGAREWPIVELAGDSYVNSYGKTIHKPIFDVVGWCAPPPAFRQPRVPPSAPLPGAIEHQPTEAKPAPAVQPDVDFGAPAAKPKQKQKQKQKTVAFGDDLDDEIPF